MTGVVIVGGGGFGREVVEIVRASADAGLSTLTVEGVVDDAPSEDLIAVMGELETTFLGTLDWLLAQRQTNVIIAIGDPAARRRVAHRLEPTAPVYPVVVHPDSTIGRDVRVAEGTVVAPGARLSTHIVVGRHVHIDQNATVGHDTVIGDFVRLNPQACVSGAVEVGAGALIGASATVLQGLRIGPDAVVGAGAVVTRSVPSSATVMGVPAR